jgi:hypothetical protein
MTDEPDNWRSIGEVLAGIVRRGDPPLAVPADYLAEPRGHPRVRADSGARPMREKENP